MSTSYLKYDLFYHSLEQSFYPHWRWYYWSFSPVLQIHTQQGLPGLLVSKEAAATTAKDS